MFSSNSLNLQVLSYQLNDSNQLFNGFLKSNNKKKIKCIKLDLSLLNLATSGLNIIQSQQNFQPVGTQGFLDLKKVSKTINIEPNTRISFAVYNSSVLFDLNPVIFHNGANCSSLIRKKNQIVSNVVSISSNRLLFSDDGKTFVTTIFQVLPVIFNYHIF